MHPNRIQPNLWILRPAGLYRTDHNNENDGRHKGIKIIRQIVLVTRVSLQHVIKALSGTEDSKKLETVLNHNSGICSVRE